MNRTVPRRTPLVFWLGLLCSLALLAAAAILIQTFASARGWTGSDPWIRSAAAHLDGLAVDGRVLALAAVALVAGLLALVIACLPARRSHRPVTSRTWASRQAIAVIATDAAERSAGVVAAHTTVRRRKIQLDLTTRPDTAGSTAPADVGDAVTERLGDLTSLPVRVHIKEDPK